jgi:hypothetical protein
MDINRIVRKIFIYTTVFLPLVAAYLVSAAVITHLFEKWPVYHMTLSTAAAAVIFSFGFHPLRQRIQTFLDAKFFRQFADREEQLHELSREVITHTTPEAMSEALMRVIAHVLHPKAGALYLRAPDRSGFVRMSQIGSSRLPERMEEENELARYFRSHPQPFVRDAASTLGSPKGTRSKNGREDAA